MYQSGTLCSRISLSCSGVSPLPLRTASMILKECSGSTPQLMRFSMMSSRVQIAVPSLQKPSRIKYWALSSQTLVPWERPEMRMSSEKVFGFVSLSMPMTKLVPNSGTPSVPRSTPSISSGLTPSASVPVKSDSTPLSSSGTRCGSVPVRSCSMRMMVGSSCPSISSFSRFVSME